MFGEKGLVVLMLLLKMSLVMLLMLLLLMIVMMMLLLLLRGLHFDFADRRVNLTPLTLVTRFFRGDRGLRFGEEEEEEAISVGDVKCKLCGTDQKSSSELTPKERRRRSTQQRIAKYSHLVTCFHDINSGK